MKKRFLSLLLAAALCIGAMPYMASTAYAAGIAEGQTELTVNQSVVAFGGYEWWVIGNANGGVYQQADSVTLLAKTLQDEWKNVTFRSSDNFNFEKTSNEYAGSTLQQKMERIANDFPEAEQSLINSRNFTGGGTYQSPSVDGITGQSLSNQKVWSLSSDEWTAINNGTVRRYGDFWWLRSPYSDHGDIARQGDISGGLLSNYFVHIGNVAVRPALNLNLESVLFTSLAAEEGGKPKEIGSLVGAEAPTGTVKFTMKDTSQTLTVGSITNSGQTLQGTYSGATAGNNQYVSCVLMDNTGAVKYYGKLEDSSSAASGTFYIPLSGVANGSYTLQIFSEQANENLYTDFCSEPVTMTLDVSGGVGTVSGFDKIHEHNWSMEWSSDDTAHWHECIVEDCPTTENSDKDSYAEHAYNQTNTDQSFLANAATCTTAATYYKSCECGAYSEAAETFTDGQAAGHSITYVKAENPTATKPGNMEYWHCSVCDTYFKDADLTEAITKEQTILAPTGEEKPEPSEPEENPPAQTDPPQENQDKTDETTDSPQTEDSSNLALWFSLMGVGAAGLCGALFLQKRRGSKVK